jgi:hypothetical protein
VRIFLVVIALALAGVALWGVWQSAVRIVSVEVQGGDPALSSYAESALLGSYAGIIPRNSIIFFPARSIRSAILTEHTNIAAVSIARAGLTKIVLTVTERTAIGKWCGLSSSIISEVPFDGEYCYLFDASGFIFAPATASSTPMNTFTTYIPLASDTEEPMRATLAHADILPSVFDFARKFSSRITPVRSVVVVGDEVQFHFVNNSKLFYVLGNERTAFGAIISAEETTDFADETIDYIDLRFDGKVYLKRKE